MLIITGLIRRFNEKLNAVQKKTTHGVISAKDAAFRGGIIVLCSILIVWVSIFLYTAFYYAYMPSISHVRPVHLEFKSCDEKKGICSFPSAHVQLTKKQQLLMVGQPYKVNLHLEMPESPANRELGMFMVCAKLKSRDGVLVEHACRSAMLHYRSTLLHTLTTLTYSPLMIFGNSEEKQSLVLELFGNFEENQSHPVTIIHVEIQSRHIEFYSASLIINAHLSGLRYLMFHWPMLSAVVGICTNLFFIALVFTLSYLHFAFEEDNSIEGFGYDKGEIDKDTGDYDKSEAEEENKEYNAVEEYKEEEYKERDKSELSSDLSSSRESFEEPERDYAFQRKNEESQLQQSSAIRTAVEDISKI